MTIHFSPRTAAWNQALLLCLGVAVLFQMACATTPSGASAAASVRGQSYAISMLTPHGTPYERSTLAQLAPVAVDAVNTVLVGKGYREASAENADLLVRLGGKFAPDFKSEVSATTGEITPAVSVENAQHRVLLIEILDNRAKTTLWSDSRSGSGGAPLPPERLRAIIAEMLRPLPNASPAQ